MLASLAISAMAAMSQIFIRGLVGDSSQISRVLLRIASFVRRGSRASA
jgi:hypothetical protein